MIYNIHYDICAMVISLFSVVFTLSKKGFRQKQNLVLFLLFCATFGAAFFDIISSIANSYVDNWSDSARNGFNYGYLLIQNLMPYLLCCYVVHVIGLTFRLGRKQVAKMFVKMAIPQMFAYLILISNPLTKLVFFYDEEGIYRHGFGMYVLYGFAFLYLLYAYYLLVKYGKNAVRITRIMVLVFETASLLAVIAQIIFPHILLQLCVESLCLLGLLVTVENEAEIVDQVTTCYNRNRFLWDMRLGLENQAAYELILIKLPNLGSYNMSVGISEVNKIMKVVGLWIRNVSKETEGYYCDNGCFAILCDKSSNSEEIMEQIKVCFQDNFVSGKTAIRFRPQIQLIQAGKEFNNLEQLLFCINGGEQTGNYNVYSDSVDRITDYKKELIMQHAIERALQYDEFDVRYQPIWDAVNNQITAAEALVRLYDDADGLIPPTDFIPFAEKRGYIVEIGEYVFESVCRFIATHDLDKAGIERVHLNLSPYQCMNEILPERFEEIREKYKVRPNQIVLEIAETGILENFDIVSKTVGTLHEKGYLFALDNYGKGALEMSYLFNLPFDLLKLDKSFLWKAEDNLKANIYFSNTMRMAKEMNMKTVVLGVEVAAQKTLLQNYECDYLQGFYYQKAISEEEFYRYSIGFNSR